MIIGIGNDIIDIGRIEKVLGRHEQRFVKRCFTKTEQEKAEKRKKSGAYSATLAKRFAAKEACSKALGTGFSKGVYMKDIGVTNDSDGKPTLSLTGGALKRLEALIPEGKKPLIHLTLTDEPPQAQAMVVIEAV